MNRLRHARVFSLPQPLHLYSYLKNDNAEWKYLFWMLDDMNCWMFCWPISRHFSWVKVVWDDLTNSKLMSLFLNATLNKFQITVCIKTTLQFVNFAPVSKHIFCSSMLFFSSMRFIRSFHLYDCKILETTCNNTCSLMWLWAHAPFQVLSQIHNDHVHGYPV